MTIIFQPVGITGWNCPAVNGPILIISVDMALIILIAAASAHWALTCTAQRRSDTGLHM